MARHLNIVALCDVKIILVLSVLIVTAILFIRACISIDKKVKPQPAIDTNGTETKTQISVYFDDEDEIRTVLLEDYIVGVVAGEMPASFEIEALKAQAVAARTFAARRICAVSGSACGSGAQICTDSKCCQAYKSEEDLKGRWGESYDYYYNKIHEAVYSTAGLIATYDGEPIEALYHSASGGMTEDAENVFGADTPYLTAVISAGEEKSPHYSDERTISRKKFAQVINDFFDGVNVSVGKLDKQVEIVSRFDSGRVECIRLGNAQATGREFRKAFDLDSANFNLKFSDENVTVSTKGYGHGVGMSQYGANYMAKNGATFAEIITYYYSGTAIENFIP